MMSLPGCHLEMDMVASARLTRFEIGADGAGIDLEAPGTAEAVDGLLRDSEELNPESRGRKCSRLAGGIVDLPAGDELVGEFCEERGDVGRGHVAEFINRAVFGKAGGEMRFIRVGPGDDEVWAFAGSELPGLTEADAAFDVNDLGECGVAVLEAVGLPEPYCGVVIADGAAEALKLVIELKEAGVLRRVEPLGIADKEERVGFEVFGDGLFCGDEFNFRLGSLRLGLSRRGDEEEEKGEDQRLVRHGAGTPLVEC
jgi:hypothetical protein